MKYIRIKYLILFLTMVLVNQSPAQPDIVEAFPNLTFDAPVDIQSPEDGTNRLFVLSQKGRIHVFDNDPDVQDADIFLDISDKVLYGGEQGLLGLAFHPNYEENGYFYIDYTTSDPKRTVIARYEVSSSEPNSADPNSETILLEVNQPYSNHNGGQISFGPDGYLYVSFGDGGSGGDPQNNGQDPGTILGSIIRIDVDDTEDGKNYAIPDSNPFKDNVSGYREEVYAYGLRNVWRFSFDPGTGMLWAGDVGQNEWEEIDIIENGKNYGWSILEGFHCYDPSTNCDESGLTMPVHEYGHNSSGGYSITGGFVYRGNDAAELLGKYIYADYVSGNVWALTYEDGSVQGNELLHSTNLNITTFGTDNEDELYFGSFSDGKVYKFDGTPVTSMGSTTPNKFQLYQNYPNPFNPKTNITFELPEKNYVTLNVYDSIGRKLEKIYEGYVDAGKTEVTWNSADYPSGVYIYKLAAGEKTLSKKMMVMK